MASDRARVHVSGRTWTACFDPAVTDFYTRHPHIGAPKLISSGYGHRADFGELDAPAVRSLVRHLEEYHAASLEQRVDNFEVRHLRSAVRRDVERLQAKARKLEADRGE